MIQNKTRFTISLIILITFISSLVAGVVKYEESKLDKLRKLEKNNHKLVSEIRRMKYRIENLEEVVK